MTLVTQRLLCAPRPDKFGFFGGNGVPDGRIDRDGDRIHRASRGERVARRTVGRGEVWGGLKPIISRRLIDRIRFYDVYYWNLQKNDRVGRLSV